MKLFPAIDLFEGKAVRLLRGDYAKMTVYADNPVDPAMAFRDAGAGHIHIVDLAGAKDGTTPNFETVCRIKRESGLFCEIGGGIRSMDTVRRYLDAGIDRVILGTAALNDPDFRREAARECGEHLAVGVDIRDGMVAVKGWTEKTDRDAIDFCRELAEEGIGTLICTDISKDGAMQGTNFALYETLRELPVNITASGGVSSIGDVKALASLNLYGAIIGKAYYTGAIDLREAIGVAE